MVSMGVTVEYFWGRGALSLKINLKVVLQGTVNI